MPYGEINVVREGRRVIIAIDLPERGELSLSGRAENLVDTRTWRTIEKYGDVLDIKLTVARYTEIGLSHPKRGSDEPGAPFPGSSRASPAASTVRSVPPSSADLSIPR